MKPAFQLGQIVYLLCRAEKLKGMVARYTVFPGGVVYHVTWGNGNESSHYAIELTDEYVSDFGDEADA